MSTLQIVLIVVIAVMAVAVAWLLFSRQRSKRLRARFGPEYQRTVSDVGGVNRAERQLERRQKRVEKLNIHPMPPEARDRLAGAWQEDQARFVDDPGGAVEQADHLVAEAMQLRGYPVADFDQRVDDLSVDHAPVVQNYRAARDIMARHTRGQASTEDLRHAIVYYRALFEDLLEVQEVR